MQTNTAHFNNSNNSECSEMESEKWVNESHLKDSKDECMKASLSFRFIINLIHRLNGRVLMDVILELQQDQADDLNLGLLDQVDIRKVMTTLMLYGYVHKAQS